MRAAGTSKLPPCARLPTTLREALAQTAAVNHRSLNAEIIHRLEQSLLADKTSLGGSKKEA